MNEFDNYDGPRPNLTGYNTRDFFKFQPGTSLNPDHDAASTPRARVTAASADARPGGSGLATRSDTGHHQ